MTSYPYEQIAILEIIQSGAVPQKLFTDAYFEGHLEKPENGSRLPAFRALSIAMTKVYGAGWSKIFRDVIQGRYKKLEEGAKK